MAVVHTRSSLKSENKGTHLVGIEVRVHEGGMYLREQIGKGALGEEEVEICLNADGKVMVGYRGHNVFVDYESLVREVAELVDRLIEEGS